MVARRDRAPRDGSLGTTASGLGMPRPPISDTPRPTTIRWRADALGLTAADVAILLGGRVDDGVLGDVMIDRLDLVHPAAVAVRDVIALDDGGMAVADMPAMLAARVYAGEVMIDLDDSGQMWLDRFDRWGEDPVTVLALAAKLGTLPARTTAIQAPAGNLIEIGTAAGVVWGGSVAAAAYDPGVAIGGRDLICYAPDPAVVIETIEVVVARLPAERVQLATMRIGRLEPWVGPVVELDDGRRATGRLQTVIDCLAARGSSATHALRLLAIREHCA